MSRKKRLVTSSSDVPALKPAALLWPLLPWNRIPGYPGSKAPPTNRWFYISGQTEVPFGPAESNSFWRVFDERTWVRSFTSVIIFWVFCSSVAFSSADYLVLGAQTLLNAASGPDASSSFLHAASCLVNIVLRRTDLHVEPMGSHLIQNPPTAIKVLLLSWCLRS